MAENNDTSELLRLMEAYEKTVMNQGPPQDAMLRTRLQQSAQRLSRSLENSFSLTHRLLASAPVETALVQTGVKMGIYETLGSSKSTVSFEQLQESTGAEESLLSRILNALVAFKSVLEVGQTEVREYKLADSAKYLADPEFSKAYLECMDLMLPAFAALPEKFAAEQYKMAQTDPRDLAVQAALDQKGTSLFEYLGANPDVAASFSQLMSTWGVSDYQPHEVYPVSRLQDSFDSSKSDTMLVDVGGGWGQKSIALKEAWPNLPGRIIVQELPHIVASAPATQLVEYQVHDAFTEQPIKGAQAYYFRRVFHDWPDDDVVAIMKRTRDAMTPGYSTLLVHELIIPRSGVEIVPVVQDFNMMSLCGSKKRSRQEWGELLGKAGLRIVEVFHSEDPSAMSVIEAARSD